MMRAAPMAMSEYPLKSQKTWYPKQIVDSTTAKPPASEGTAYTVTVRPGTPVLTSGLGATFPRGIPIGKVDRVLDAQGAWRKSFWIEPMVEPGVATHVLVLTEGSRERSLVERTGGELGEGEEEEEP